MNKSIKIDNGARTVSVGDSVEYKYGVETVGKVIKIEGDILTIETDDEGFHQIVQEEANRCW